MTPTWVGPAVAISLMIIALSFLVMGAVVLALGLALRTQSAKAKAQIASITGDLRSVTLRIRQELEGYAELSTEARGKLRGAIDTVEGRLQDLDALVEVIQEEAEETVLDVTSMVRTVRRTGGILGAARKMMRRRRSED